MDKGSKERKSIKTAVPSTHSFFPLSLIIVWTISVIVLLVSLTVYNKAYACEVSYPSPTAEETFGNSVTVFAGKVAKIQNYTVEGVADWHLVSFEVDKYWKTLDENDYKQAIILTGIDDGACGYEFEVAKTYMVYAIKWWHDPNSLYTGLGYRNQPIENAQEDLAFLGEGKVPTKELSWEEQIDRITIQPMPTVQEEQATSKILSMVGIGGAIAGTVAFFTLRRLKRK